MSRATERVEGLGDGPGSGPAERWRLLDEREFLQRSLEDAEREHAAGDLADADFALLCRRDTARLAAVEASLAALDRAVSSGEGRGAPAAATVGRSTVAEPAPSTDPAPPTEPAPSTDPAEPGAPDPVAETRRRPSEGVADVGARPPRGGQVRTPGRARPRPGGPGRRRRPWLAVVGVACLVAGAVLLVVQLASPRLPGQTPTGSIDLSQAQKEAQQLQQAQSLVDGGHPSQALQVYGKVLTEDPKNPVALSEWGWLEWQAATAAGNKHAAADGQAAVAKAIQRDPKLYDAQYYLGAILLDGGHAAQAVGHFRHFLSDHPTQKWLSDAAPAIRKAFADVGQPVPTGVPAASPGSSSSSTSAPATTPTSS